MKDNSSSQEDILHLVETAFYVNNCFDSVTKAKTILNRMHQLLSTGGFNIRQLASNTLTVVEHLTAEAKAASTEVWLSQPRQDPEEPVLDMPYRLPWVLSETSRVFAARILYKEIATQYDPLRYLIPFTTRQRF